MKKLLLTLFFCSFVLCCSEAFAQSKKSDAGNDSPIVWTKKSKDFNGKNVSTLVADIGKSGYANSDALFVVVPISTATAKKNDGGKINVLIPFSAFEKFNEKYAPQIEKGGNAFGSKAVLKSIAGTFLVHKGEPVLLVGIKAETLAQAPKASEVLETQIATEDQATGATKSSKEGYTKKFFNVSKIGKDRALKTEFSRLMTLYNKGKKRDEKMKPDEAKMLLEDGGDPLTVFEDAKKIEWEIRN